MTRLPNISILLAFFIFHSCIATPIYIIEKPKKQVKINTYTGWWIYGQNHHIFKDEATLEEWIISFINEDPDQVKTLFLEIAEMEYFPLECIMHGRIIQKKKDKILEVSNFEITHIQGCDEE